LTKWYTAKNPKSSLIRKYKQNKAIAAQLINVNPPDSELTLVVVI
jgi:hypothetical protein